MLLRSTLIYAPAVLFTRLSALLLLVVATRIMDKSEYGLLALVVTIGEMADGAASNWLRIVLLRLGGKGDIARGTLVLAGRLLAGTTLLAVLVAIVAAFTVVPERWASFAFAAGLYLIAGSLSRFALTVLQMQQRHLHYSLLEFARAVLGIVLPVGAVLLIEPTFLAASIGTSLAVGMVGALAMWMALSKTVAGPARFAVAELLALGVPLIVVALLGFGIDNAERLILKVYFDAGAVAVYVAAYSLARQPIDILSGAVNLGGFPELVNRYDEKGPAAAGAFLAEQMALIARLALPVAALLVVLAPDIVGFVLPEDYRAEAPRLFLPIVLAVLFANTRAFVYANIFHAAKRNWLLIWAMVPGSAAGIAFGLVLIPRYAIEGAAWALAGGELVGLIANVVLSHRLLVLPLPLRALATAGGIAVLTGLAAHGAVAFLPEAGPFWRLLAGGAAGGATFLALSAASAPVETRMLLSRLGI